MLVHDPARQGSYLQSGFRKHYGTWHICGEADGDEGEGWENRSAGMKRRHPEHARTLPCMGNLAIGEYRRRQRRLFKLFAPYPAPPQPNNQSSDDGMTCGPQTWKGGFWVWTISRLCRVYP